MDRRRVAGKLGETARQVECRTSESGQCRPRLPEKTASQVELYAALQAAGAELPRDPEAFRLWLHRARKQGLVTKFHAQRSER